MLYTSTRHNTHPVPFVEALWNPRASDGGLYMPATLPTLPKAVIDNMRHMTMAEIGYLVFNAILGNDFTTSEIKEIVSEAYSFDAPLVPLDDSNFVLELFGGPTLAVKDFSARLTARLLEHTLHSGAAPLASGRRPVNILIATTGNSGSAMANALAGVKDVNVFIVFPRGTATRALEAQFTTTGANVWPVEVSGSIDACQTLVATALGDSELNSRYTMLSANSGNIARLLGQTVCYFYGVSRVAGITGRRESGVVTAVPCGNLGNLTAGLLAKRMGLGISRFVACENSNNYLERALLHEDFSPRDAIPTLAYGADKSVPTNIERILDLYGANIDSLKRDVLPVSVSDPEIISAINGCYDKTGYLLDPHAAMAYYGMEKVRSEASRNNGDDTFPGLIMATAHPAKSLTAMSAITGRPIELPLQLTRFMGLPDHRIRIKPIYSSLRKIITEANRV